MAMKLRDLIRKVRACKTAADERAVISTESAQIRTAFKEEQNEYRHRNVAKLLYIHMLGYPTHFGQMECIKLIASGRFSEKRIGYLALMLLLDEKQEVLTLVTNSLQVDLNATSTPYAVGLALAAVGNIGSSEIARDLANDVEKLLKSPSPYIRKKAALTVIRMIRKVPDLIDSFLPSIVSLLLDKNHNVLLTGVALVNAVVEVAPEYTEKFTKLVPALVKILRKLVTAGYAPEYDVGGVTDPFLQARILTLLRALGKGNAGASEAMNNILAQVASTIDAGKNAGNAVLYECVNTIMTVESEPGLRVLAVNILGKFLSGKDNNIKYVALQTLCKVVHLDAPAVQRHRAIIVDCLKDGDVSIRRRALELVYALVNGDNVRLLTKEMLNYLSVADLETRPDLCVKIAAVAARYAPSKRWHVDTLISMLAIAGDVAKGHIGAATIFQISHSGTANSSNSSSAAGSAVVGEDHAAITHKLFTMAATAAAGNTEAQQLLLQVAVWCMGEYGQLLLSPPPAKPTNKAAQLPPPIPGAVFLAGSVDDNTSGGGATAASDITGPYGETRTETDIVKLLDRILHLYYSNSETKGMVLTALLKLCFKLRDATVLTRMKALLTSYGVSPDVELQQRSVEFTQIVNPAGTPTLSEAQRKALLEPMPLLEEAVLRARAGGATGETADAAALAGEDSAMTVVERTTIKAPVSSSGAGAGAGDLFGMGASTTTSSTTTKSNAGTSLLDTLDDLFSTVTKTADVPLHVTAAMDAFGTTTTTTSSMGGPGAGKMVNNNGNSADLLGDLFAVPSPAPAPAAAAIATTIGTSSGGGLDIGALFAGLPTSTPSSNNNSVIATTPSTDIFGLGGGGGGGFSSMPAPTPAPVPITPAAATGNLDIFGMSTPAKTASASSVMMGSAATLGFGSNTMTTTPIVSAMRTPDLFDLGNNNTPSSTIAPPVLPSSATGLSPFTSSSSSSPNTASSSSPSFVAFESAASGVRVVLQCTKIGGATSAITDVTATYSSSSSSLTKFVCQAAVPKFMKLTMQPASGDVLTPTTSIVQVLRIENSQQGVKPLALRLKLAFNVGTSVEQMVEQTDVRNFPAGW